MKMRYLLVPLLLSVMLPLASPAQVAVGVSIAPPALPVYTQPACPVDGYIWQPGYWAWNGSSYYWVSGAWVAPPQIGFYWTPGYWGFSSGVYSFFPGYWGPTVGFYGGINYGYGYYGSGYYGGRWYGNQFRYNTAVSRVNTNVIHNTYADRSVVRNANARRVSYNGPGGTSARPTAAQRTAAQAAHRELPNQQMAGRNAARTQRQALSRENQAARQTQEAQTHARAANPSQQNLAHTQSARRTTTAAHTRTAQSSHARQSHSPSVAHRNQTIHSQVSHQTRSVKQPAHARNATPRNQGHVNASRGRPQLKATGQRVAKSNAPRGANHAERQ